MGDPDFMEGSLISYEIGDPGVLKILGNWGRGSLISYENGDPGAHFHLTPGGTNFGGSVFAMTGPFYAWHCSLLILGLSSTLFYL